MKKREGEREKGGGVVPAFFIVFYFHVHSIHSFNEFPRQIRSGQFRLQVVECK